MIIIYYNGIDIVIIINNDNNNGIGIADVIVNRIGNCNND